MSTHAYVSVYDASEYSIVLMVKKACSNDTYVFTIHKITGSIDFSGLNQHSVFPDRAHAEGFIDVSYHATLLATGIGLLGVQRFGPRLCIAIVTDATPVAYFANMHEIYKITNVRYLWFNIPYFRELNAKETRRVNRLEDFPVADFHMFCDTCDLTSTLGRKIHKPDFIWNQSLAKPFSDLGVRDACLYLLEGTATSSILKLGDDIRRFTLITIRSAEHPGTRYTARGLNEGAYPANEVQCELIIESSDGLIFSHVWRRGTVPVEWRTNTGTALPTASLAVGDNCDTLTPKYFDRINKEFGSKNFKGFLIMNLLHNNETHSERKLCDAYKHAVEKMKNVYYREFDWHHKLKELGTAACVEEYWKVAVDAIGDPTFTVIEPESAVKPDVSQTGTLKFANDDILKNVNMRVAQMQDAIVRVNCMDSLDRTNVGCFYFCALVVLRYMGRAAGQPPYSMLEALEEPIRRFLANAFIAIGDTVSLLYTNTPACMTNIFRDTGGIEDRAASDGAIAVQRRYENFLKDKTRAKVIDIFVGHALDRLLPNVDTGMSLICASGFPGCFIPPFPGALKNTSKLISLLDYNPSYLTLDHVKRTAQITILLSRPVYVESIVMRSIQGSVPNQLQLEGGLTLSALVPLCSNFGIPTCATPTTTILRIPPDIANGASPLCRIVRLTMMAQEGSLSLSNIFVFGHEHSHNPSFYWFPDIYNDFSSLKKDTRWPRITDTSPLSDIIMRSKKPTFDSAIEIELARLHHGHTKLETIAKMFAIGLNPSEFALRRFRYQKNAGRTELQKHSCGTPAELQWRCNDCGRIYCDKCSSSHYIASSFFVTEPSFFCDECFEKHESAVESLKNVRRFYDSYNRLHSASQYRSEIWYESHIMPHSTHLLEFPRTAFIVSPAPEMNNLLISRFEVGDSNSFQIALGATHIISKIEIDCSENCIVHIHALANIVNVEGDQVASLDASHKKIEVAMCANLILLYIGGGSLYSLRFYGDPYVRQMLNASPPSSPPPKLPDSITKRINVNASDPVVVFKMSRPTSVHGVLLEKAAGVGALVALFAEAENDRAGDHEYFYLPEGLTDYAVRFSSPRISSCVKILIASKTPEFNSAKLALF